ncbi:hypothetical protein CAC02_08100 [Streptococcus gallolyticus]|uniref:Uncharacterized protein n=1 Tax=Streptococcus gallolyticus TaxID=315405 RepID=A0A368UC32_9STRE|nr:hypothetical protein CAC02_08100 [Streptococcus gallolyticus]
MGYINYSKEPRSNIQYKKYYKDQKIASYSIFILLFYYIKTIKQISANGFIFATIIIFLMKV